MLYLAGHDLAVDAADVDAGVDAGLVVGVDDVAPRLADAAGRRQAARVEAAEDASEHVVGEQVHGFQFPWQIAA